jgi:hypothetical protein
MLGAPKYTVNTHQPCRRRTLHTRAAMSCPFRGRVVTFPQGTRAYIWGRSSSAARVVLLPRDARRRHGRRRRASVPACVPSCPTFQAPPLGSVETPADATCPGRAVPSPGVQLLRPPSRGSAVPPSPAPPNPVSSHQSVTAG